jgi:hypothetical protein
MTEARRFRYPRNCLRGFPLSATYRCGSGERTASPRGRRLSSRIACGSVRTSNGGMDIVARFRRYSRHSETRGHHEHAPPIQRAPRHCTDAWSQPQHRSRQPPSELLCRTFRGRFAASTHCNRRQAEANKLAKQLTSGPRYKGATWPATAL